MGIEFSDSDIEIQTPMTADICHFCVNNEDQFVILTTNHTGSYVFRAGRFQEFERDYEIEEAQGIRKDLLLEKAQVAEGLGQELYKFRSNLMSYELGSGKNVFDAIVE